MSSDRRPGASAATLAEVVADVDRGATADEVQELGEEVRRQVLLGPAADPAFEAPFAQRSRGARGGGDANGPVVVVERLQPEVPPVGVDELIEHEEGWIFGARPTGFDGGTHEILEALLKQQRVVEAHPPDAVRVDAVADQVTDGLVERSGLTDTARTEDELEPVWVVIAKTAPQQLRQRSFHLSSERVGNDAPSLPWTASQPRGPDFGRTALLPRLLPDG